MSPLWHYGLFAASFVHHMAGTFVGAFAVLALVLAGVGIYGLVAYSMRQRTRIRVALGGQPGDVLRRVLGRGMRIILIALVIRVVASLGLARLMTSPLFGVSAGDPLTFSAVVLLLAFIALLAVCRPACRDRCRALKA